MGEFSHKPVRGIQFDLVDLPSRGETLSGSVPPGELGLEDEARLRYLSPVDYRLHLEAVNGGRDLLVRGSLSLQVEAVCDRCEGAFPLALSTEEVCHEVKNAFGTTVDLSDELREDILMSLPHRFLCREDCAGLCPRCGANLNKGACGCPEEEGGEDGEDPWASLKGLPPSPGEG